VRIRDPHSDGIIQVSDRGEGRAMLTKQPKGRGWLLSIDECPADADSPQADLLMTAEELTELRDLLTEAVMSADTWAPPHGPGPSTPIDELQAAHHALNALLGVGRWQIRVGEREGLPGCSVTWLDGERPRRACGTSLGELVTLAREQVLADARTPAPCAVCHAWWVDEDRGPNACPLCRRTAP
jgi:hypothetical protein